MGVPAGRTPPVTRHGLRPGKGMTQVSWQPFCV